MSGCVALSGLRPEEATSTSLVTTVLIHGAPLKLHLTAPRQPTAGHAIVLYASGDGGWFGTAKTMFDEIGDAGYHAVGFSSRALLKVVRSGRHSPSSAELAAAYEEILSHARLALGLDAATSAVLTGWSRGAAFAVLVGAECAVPRNVIGVIAIGLAENENLISDGSETDRAWKGQPRPVDTYAVIGRRPLLPYVVIQASRDKYFPADDARQRFGPDSARHKLVAVDARSHSFAGGTAAFHAALVGSLHWMVSPAEDLTGGVER
jgi:hypothetical protein